MQQLRPGSLLQGGKYKIEKVLGQGGFGITYLAVQTGLNRRVAIKEFFMKEYCERNSTTSHVSLGTSGSRETVERFRQKFVKEAQNIACLNHPHIIRIHDIFEENGTAYYVMEYHGKGSLADLVKNGGCLGESTALRYIRQVADALKYIHNRHMNHLDVKPGNILLDECGNAVLIDFGLSKRYDDEGEQTSTTPIGISHGYAPLEQYKKGGVGTFSPATDIYSLGATLYKLLTGNTPPEANDVMDDGLPPLPATVSPATASFIEKAMQPARKNRPQSIEECMTLLEAEPIKEELEEETKPIFAKPTDTPKQEEVKPKVQTVPKQKTSKKWLLPLIVGVLTALTVIFWPKGKEKEVEEVATKQEVAQQPVDKPSSGTINGHRYVDLGLSVKWADRNVGASSPSDYGDYFAWGETSPKFSYDINNCVTWEKNIGDIAGNARYDAARANWGSSWRLPTYAECQELIDKCTWTWTTQGGHKGYKVTGRNGNSIFLPAAGWRYGSSLSLAGEYGDYWSSTPHESNTQLACSLYFGGSNQSAGWYRRATGKVSGRSQNKAKRV